MKIKYIFSVILLNQFIGHCSTINCFRTSLSSSSASSSSSSANNYKPVENVQLIERINGKYVKLEQQDYNELLKITLKSGGKFKDPQFPMKSSFSNFNRPPKISRNPVLVIKNNRDKSFHVKQRCLGDCWFLAALLNLKYYENLFNFIVPLNDQSFEKDKYAGIFHFRFWQAGEWVDIVIDDRIYTMGWFRKSPLFTTLKSSNEFWVPLIEKAYAKLNYRSYKNIDGGFTAKAMQDLSGCIPEFYFVEMKHETLFEIIYDAKLRQTMMTCGTYDEETMKKMKKENSLKIDLDHAYAITAVKIVKKKTFDHEFKLIRIQNPDGVRALIGYSDKIKKIYTKSNKFDRVTMESELPIQVDGESWILYEDFIYHFRHVDICNLTPNSIVGDIYTKSGSKKLSLSAKKGIFMGGTLSKVVEDNDMFVMKPQYRIVLTEPDEGRENDSICSILINLSLKNQRDYENFMNIELEIYVLAYDGIEENKLSKPFDDFRHQFSYNTFFTSVSGIVSKRLDLKLGTYYIVPSIKSDLQGTNFYLQIMSEQKNILEVYDRNIHVVSKTEKIHNLKSGNIEDKDSELFLQMATENRIDFKGLYNIFLNNEFSLNKNCRNEYQLDDEIFDKLKLVFETKKFMPKKELSIERIRKILLELEEEYENFPKKEHDTMTYTLFMTHLFTLNGYSKKITCIKDIHYIFDIKKNSINFNDFILIMMTLKSHLGSYCEKFNVKLIKDLISLVLSDDEYLSYEIDIQGFKKIIQFIKPLKEKFMEYASISSFISTSYHTVPFTKFKKLLDSIDYKLTYNMVATIYQTYGNVNEIFYEEFIQSVVDITTVYEQVSRIINVNDKSKSDLQEVWFCDFWKALQSTKR